MYNEQSGLLQGIIAGRGDHCRAWVHGQREFELWREGLGGGEGDSAAQDGTGLDVMEEKWMDVRS